MCINMHSICYYLWYASRMKIVSCSKVGVSFFWCPSVFKSMIAMWAAGWQPVHLTRGRWIMNRCRNNYPFRTNLSKNQTRLGRVDQSSINTYITKTLTLTFWLFLILLIFIVIYLNSSSKMDPKFKAHRRWMMIMGPWQHYPVLVKILRYTSHAYPCMSPSLVTHLNQSRSSAHLLNVFLFSQGWKGCLGHFNREGC